MDHLPYTAITHGGDAFEVRFPLHPETRAPEQVAEMLSQLLSSLGGVIDRGDAVSDGDVLQALAMATAIRARMVKAPLPASEQLLQQLLGDAFEAVDQAVPKPAARA
jgi:hypothetical protein